MIALTVALIINAGSPEGKITKYVEPMPSMEVCLVTLKELIEAADESMYKYGFSVACFAKQTGEPS